MSSAISIVRGGQTLENRGKEGDALYPTEITAGIGCTTNSGKNGLVVCGHNMALGDLIYLNGVQIGKVTYVQFAAGIGDYAIITLNDNFKADGSTYVTHNSIRHNYRSHNPLLNEKLFKYSECKGFATFTVIDQNKSLTYYYGNDGEAIGTITISGLVEARYASGIMGPGDSGCGVFHNSREDDYTSFLEFSGIVHGGNDERTRIYFTPPQHIDNCTIATF